MEEDHQVAPMEEDHHQNEHQEEDHQEEEEISSLPALNPSPPNDEEEEKESSNEEENLDYEEYMDEEDWTWGRFIKSYKCHLLSKSSRPNPETYGNRIILPPSALPHLLRISLSFPMMFILENPKTGKHSHGGVLEFTSQEGTIIMPDWMMENLALEEGDDVVLYDTFFEKGTFVKLQPHNVAFLELTNPKAVLEILLRNFVCLACGDTIMLEYNNHKFYIDVLETKPYEGICIIDTDCEVDFATPLDYKELEKEEKKELEFDDQDQKVSNNVKIKFVPFEGKAQRLDGKPTIEVATKEVSIGGSATTKGFSGSNSRSQKDGLKSRRLVFGSNSSVQSSKEDGNIKEEEKSKKESQSFQAFSGKSYKLTN